MSALSKTLLDEMNEQIKHELYSAYLYLSMSAFFQASNLAGFAHWMSVQAKEETGHALKFFEYINDRDGRVILQAIDQPPVEFKNPTTAFEQTLEHEKKVTARINHLFDIAVQDKDYASQGFLQWFVNEQVEEEKNATRIVQTLKMGADKGTGIFMLDHELSER